MKSRPTEWYGNTERTHLPCLAAVDQFVRSAWGSLHTRQVSERITWVAQLQGADTLVKRQQEAAALLHGVDLAFWLGRFCQAQSDRSKWATGSGRCVAHAARGAASP